MDNTKTRLLFSGTFFSYLSLNVMLSFLAVVVLGFALLFLRATSSSPAFYLGIACYWAACLFVTLYTIYANVNFFIENTQIARIGDE